MRRDRNVECVRALIGSCPGRHQMDAEQENDQNERGGGRAPAAAGPVEVTQQEEPEQREAGKCEEPVMDVVVAPESGRQEVDIGEIEDLVHDERHGEHRGNRAPERHRNARQPEHQPGAPLEQPLAAADPGARINEDEIGLEAEIVEREPDGSRHAHVFAQMRAVDRQVKRPVSHQRHQGRE